MTCELKLQLRIVQKKWGDITVLKFLQRLALDYPYICLSFFLQLSYRQMYRKFKKLVLGLLGHITS